MTRIKIKSLAFFSLLPIATLLATEEGPKKNEKIPYYLVKFYKISASDMSRNPTPDTQNYERPLKQPVDKEGYLSAKPFAEYNINLKKKKNKLMVFEIGLLKNYIADVVNFANNDIGIIRKKKDLIKGEDLFLCVVRKPTSSSNHSGQINTNTKNSPYILPLNNTLLLVPAGSEIHVLVNSNDIPKLKTGLKGLKSWETGTIVGVILGGVAVIGAAGGAIYYALQPKAPVKKKKKEEEEENEEKLETAPKKTEVA